MRIKQTIPFFLTLLGITLDHLAYWCAYSVDICYGSLIHQSLDFLAPIYLFSVITLPLAIILCFVPSAVFKSWLKFSLWGIPLVVFVVAITPDRSGAMMPIYSFIQKDAVFLMSSLFVMVSIGIIGGKLLTTLLDKHLTNSPVVLRTWLNFAYFWASFSIAFILIPVLLDKFLDGYFFNFLGFPISLEYGIGFLSVFFILASVVLIIWKYKKP